MPVAIKECKRCKHGNVLQNYGELECLQCGAEHDEQGNLIPHPKGYIDLRKVSRGWHNRKVKDDNFKTS